jgi:hypothetical protein
MTLGLSVGKPLTEQVGLYPTCGIPAKEIDMDMDNASFLIIELMTLSMGARPIFVAQICQYIKNIENAAHTNERIGPLQVEVLCAANG